MEQKREGKAVSNKRDLKAHGWNMFESVKKAFFENQENLTWTGY